MNSALPKYQEFFRQLARTTKSEINDQFDGSSTVSELHQSVAQLVDYNEVFDLDVDSFVGRVDEPYPDEFDGARDAALELAQSPITDSHVLRREAKQCLFQLTSISIKRLHRRCLIKRELGEYGSIHITNGIANCTFDRQGNSDDENDERHVEEIRFQVSSIEPLTGSRRQYQLFPNSAAILHRAPEEIHDGLFLVHGTQINGRGSENSRKVAAVVLADLAVIAFHQPQVETKPDAVYSRRENRIQRRLQRAGRIETPRRPPSRLVSSLIVILSIAVCAYLVLPAVEIGDSIPARSDQSTISKSADELAALRDQLSQLSVSLNQESLPQISKQMRGIDQRFVEISQKVGALEVQLDNRLNIPSPRPVTESEEFKEVTGQIESLRTEVKQLYGAINLWKSLLQSFPQSSYKQPSSPVAVSTTPTKSALSFASFLADDEDEYDSDAACRRRCNREQYDSNRCLPRVIHINHSPGQYVPSWYYQQYYPATPYGYYCPD